MFNIRSALAVLAESLRKPWLWSVRCGLHRDLARCAVDTWILIKSH